MRRRHVERAPGTVLFLSPSVRVPPPHNVLTTPSPPRPLVSQVVLLFDLKINSHSAVTAPLPLTASAGFTPLYSDSWRVHAPDYIIDPQAGRVGQLCLDLPAIARSSIDKFCLLQFLLYRSNAQPVILTVLRTALVDLEPLAEVARMFALVNTPEAQVLLEKAVASPHEPAPAADMPPSALLQDAPPAALATRPASIIPTGAQCTPTHTPRPAAAAPGVGAEGEASVAPPPQAQPSASSVPPQARVDPATRRPSRSLASRHIVAAVFRPAISALPATCDEQCSRRRHLLAAMSLYLHSQLQAGLPADPELGSLLLSLLVQQGSFSQLHQLVRTRAVPDSLGLAQELLELETLYAPAAELGMDMLRRLGAPAHGLIVDHLVRKGDVMAACRTIRHLRLLAYPSRPLLEVAAARRDPTVFPTVYAFLALRNRSCRGSTSFLPEEDCDEFTARYNEQLRARGGP